MGCIEADGGVWSVMDHADYGGILIFSPISGKSIIGWQDINCMLRHVLQNRHHITCYACRLPFAAGMKDQNLDYANANLSDTFVEYTTRRILNAFCQPVRRSTNPTNTKPSRAVPIANSMRPNIFEPMVIDRDGSSTKYLSSCPDSTNRLYCSLCSR